MSAALAGFEEAGAAPADPGSASASDPTAQATTPPVTPETAAPATAPPDQTTTGPIPLERHKAILENTRVKARDEALQQFRAEYGDQIQQITAFRQDPVTGIQNLLSEGLGNPELRPMVTAAIARAFRGLGQASPAATPEPQADLQGTDATGQPVAFYSAEQLAKWHEWNNQRLTAQIEERIAPLQKREQALTAQERSEAYIADTAKRLQPQMEQLKGRPHYDANKDAIYAKAKELIATGQDPMSALWSAYAVIVEEVVMPARASADQQALREAAVQKATGSSRPPGVTTPSPASRPRSMSEGLRQQGVTSF